MKSLTEDEIKSLMNSEAYQNKNHPKYKETQETASKAWENLYLDDDRNKNPENYYIWRTVGDGKVRSSHEDRDGEVFCWDMVQELVKEERMIMQKILV